MHIVYREKCDGVDLTNTSLEGLVHVYVTHTICRYNILLPVVGILFKIYGYTLCCSSVDTFNTETGSCSQTETILNTGVLLICTYHISMHVHEPDLHMYDDKKRTISRPCRTHPPKLQVLQLIFKVTYCKLCISDHSQ